MAKAQHSPQARRRLFRGWPLVLGVAGTIVSNCAVLFRTNPSEWILFFGAGLLLVGGAVLIGLLRLLRSWRDDGRAAAGWRELCCERCGFDLRGSPDGRCPECGSENWKFAKLVGETGPELLNKARGDAE